MSEWVAEHWTVLVCAILYVILNGTSISLAWKRRLRTVMQALEHTVEPLHPLTDGRAHVRNEGLDGDTLIDSVLDGISPKGTKELGVVPRVSKGRRLLNGILKFLPFVLR